MPGQQILVTASEASFLLINFVLALVVVVVGERLPCFGQFYQSLVRVVENRKPVR